MAAASQEMGRKKNRRQADDDDYFSSLPASAAEPTPAPAAAPADDAAGAADATGAAEDGEAPAPLADDAPAPSADDAPAPSADDASEAPADDGPEASGDEAPEAPAGDGATPPAPEDTPLVRLLASLRLRKGAAGGLGALLAAILYAVVALMAGAAATARVEAAHQEGAEARAAAEREREEALNRERAGTSLWCPVRERWLPRAAAAEGASLRRAEGPRGGFERWRKNLKTKSKKGGGGPKGDWVRCKAGEGWASACEAALLEVEAEDIGASAVRFLAVVDGEVLDVTDWIDGHLVTRDAALRGGAVDSGRALFEVRDGGGATGLRARLDGRFRPPAEGGAEGAGGPKKGRKEKKSRAEKKALKAKWGR